MVATEQSGTLGPDEVAGSIAARHALGPEGEQAVIADFLERTGRAIDRRVDERVYLHQATQPEPRRREDRSPIGLALGSIALAIPISGIATQLHGPGAVIVMLVAWLAIAAINISYQRSRRN